MLLVIEAGLIYVIPWNNCHTLIDTWPTVMPRVLLFLLSLQLICIQMFHSALAVMGNVCGQSIKFQ